MPSYVVTGASRGLGFGFIDNLSSNPDNIVIGFVRNETEARAKVNEKLSNRSNLHIIRGDLDDYDSLKEAFRRTTEIVEGGLDYLIANAGVSGSALESLTERGTDPKGLEKELMDVFHTNVVGNVNLINLALPLLEKGSAKKILVLTTGLADVNLTADYNLFETPSYAISKAALDMMVAKYHAEHNPKGLLFMAISPGVVDTGNTDMSAMDAEMGQRMQNFFGKFAQYAPHFTGPIRVEESVTACLSVLDRATIKEFGGKAVSHFGNRQWL